MQFFRVEYFAYTDILIIGWRELRGLRDPHLPHYDVFDIF